MKRALKDCVRLALMFLLLLGPGLPGGAQAPQDRVSFKATITGPSPTEFLVPLVPPITIVSWSWKGDIALLGQTTLFISYVQQNDLEGMPLSYSGVMAFTVPNGDALFANFSGQIRGTATPEVFAIEGTFVVTGGRGRFAGAAGSGVCSATADGTKRQWTCSFDGTVAVPKP